MSKNWPTFILDFEKGNEEQKAFCLKLKDNFEYEKSINYVIKSNEGSTFSVKLEIENQIYEISNEFDDSEDKMNEILQKIYKLLDEQYHENLLLFNFENKYQKEYYLNLKDNFTYKTDIGYKITIDPATPFYIKLKIKDNIYDIQNEFDSSEERANESLNKIYKLLDNME